MYGYIAPNKNTLGKDRELRYRSFYCGLCRTLKERFGNLSRVTLNYDFTFLIILLTSLYEPDGTEGAGPCIAHPFQRRAFIKNRFTDFAADMTVLFAYYKCLDDYNDENKRIRGAEAKLLARELPELRNRYPELTVAAEKCFSKISESEKTSMQIINSKAGTDCHSEENLISDIEADAVSNAYAELMGEVFASQGDRYWSPALRTFGIELGQFIYMMDAVCDYDEDCKHNRYNPLRLMPETASSAESRKKLLKMLAGDAAAEFEKLPLLQDVDIMRNILYSGVWAYYQSKFEKERE